MKATISEIGMVRAMIKVALHRPKNRNTTNTTKIEAYINVSCRLLIDFTIKSELSEMIWNLMSVGNSFIANSSCFFASLATATALASVCLVIISTPPRPRLIVCSSVMSLIVSRTTATSCK